MGAALKRQTNKQTKEEPLLNWGHPSQPASTSSINFILYSKFFIIISIVFTAASPVGYPSRNHFLCSSIEAAPPLLKFDHDISAIQSHLQAHF